MPIYVIGHINIKNYAQWAEYRSQVRSTLAPWGGEVLCGTCFAVLTGEHRHNVIRFADPPPCGPGATHRPVRHWCRCAPARPTWIWWPSKPFRIIVAPTLFRDGSPPAVSAVCRSVAALCSARLYMESSNKPQGVEDMMQSSWMYARAAVAAGVLFAGWANVAGGSCDWDSPIDHKYETKSPELYRSFDEARSTLDSWRGQKDRLLVAEKLLIEVLQKDPDYAPAYREMGRVFIMAGYTRSDPQFPKRPSSAETVILKAIEIENQYADAYSLLGHLYTKQGRLDEAHAALKRAEELGTGTPWLDLNWAALLSSRGEREGAYRRYLKVAESAPANKKAYGAAIQGVYWYFVETRQLEEAEKWHLKEVEVEPESAWSWGNLASFHLFWRGNVDGAIDEAQKALTLMEYDQARFVLGCALYAKLAVAIQGGKITEARALSSRAESVYPDRAGAVAELAKFPATRFAARILREQSVGMPRAAATLQ